LVVGRASDYLWFASEFLFLMASMDLTYEINKPGRQKKIGIASDKGMTMSFLRFTPNMPVRYTCMVKS